MKSVTIGIVFTFLMANLFAQSDNTLKDRKWKFGFDLGLNYSYAIVNKPLPNHATLTNKIGFRLGVLAEYKISKLISLSPKTELSFNNAIIEYEYNPLPYRIMPVTLELMTPVLFNLENIKLNPYCFVGPNVKIPLSKKTVDPSFFPAQTDLSIDFGIGVRKGFSSFNFSPELRFSFGFLNINRDPAMNYLYNQSISLVLKFIE